MKQPQDNLEKPYLYLIAPALPVILGVIFICWQNGISGSVLWVSLLLICLGFCCGGVLWQSHVNGLAQTNARWLQDENTKLDAVATYTRELERLLLTISPILSQHVMVSREHTEQEIISLTNRFSGMVNDLQQIVDSTDSTMDGQHFHLDSVLTTSRNFLQPVLASLKLIEQNKNEINAHLCTISGNVNELNCLTVQLSKLTGQLQRGAADLDPEAATNLAHEAFHLEQQFTQIVKTISVALTTALASTEQNTPTQGSLLSTAEIQINQTLSHLSQSLNHYRNDVDALRNNAEQIRGEINNVLVALQFQDRVSQILTQVENNLLNLQQTIETIQQQGIQRDGAMLQVDAAVEHIESNYKAVNLRTEREADGSDDLTFF